MTYKPPYQSYQEQQNKKKSRAPFIYATFSVLFIIAGVVLIFLWINSSGGSEFKLFKTKTPTPTITNTPLPPTSTATITPVPSETLIPSATPTGTAAAPFEYIVQSGDSLYFIAEKFQVEQILITVLNGLRDDFLTVGQVLLIPNPDMIMPTATALPPGLLPGDVIEYMVLPGDTVKAIADRFLSTEDAIVTENELEDSYLIYPGQILLVPYWLITPTFGAPEATSTTVPPSVSP